EASLAGLEEQALTWFRLGECRIKLGDYAAALTAYDRAFALDGRLYQARVASAEAHAHLGDLELAEQDAMSAAELAPESPGARDELAWTRQVRAYRDRAAQKMARRDHAGARADL